MVVAPSWQINMLAISHNDLDARLCLAIVTTLVAMDLVVLFLRSELPRYCPSALVLNMQGTEGNADKAHFTPVFTPRVAHHPIWPFCLVFSPAHHRNNVVCFIALRLHDSSFVVEQRASINATGNGAAAVDFLLHCCNPPC